MYLFQLKPFIRTIRLLCFCYFAPRLKKLSSIPVGVRHMLLSTFFFALMNVCIKKVSHLPEMEIVFFRCMVAMLICFGYIFKHKLDWKGSNRLLLFLRGFFGTIAVYTFFVTLHSMPLGTAVTIQYLSPVFTTIIAIFLLKEGVKPMQWLFFLLSFGGVIFIKGFDQRFSIGILLIGILSAMSSGFAYNFVRSLKEREAPMVVVLHFQIIGTIVGGIGCLFSWQNPSATDWLYLVAIGVLTQLGQTYLTKALQAERAANVSILNYLGVIYALIFGWLIFDEHYPLQTFVGIILVIGGVLLNYIYTSRKAPVEEKLSGVEE